MAAIQACFTHCRPTLSTLVEFYRSKLVGLFMTLSSDTMEMDLHADQYKAIEQGRFAVTTLFSCMMLHGHTYGPLRHLLRREWSFAACCFANMDDIARYHYSDYNVWVRSPFGKPTISRHPHQGNMTPGLLGSLDSVPDYTFYHKIRLGTKACLEILISWCDG